MEILDHDHLELSYGSKRHVIIPKLSRILTWGKDADFVSAKMDEDRDVVPSTLLDTVASFLAIFCLSLNMRTV